MNVTEFLRPENWRADASGPRYVQLRRRLEEGIAKGLLAPDSPLPPEREIAALTELSRVTVRKAIQELVNQGSVIQKQGSGSFVTRAGPRVEQSLSRLTSFTEDMARRGFSVESVFLDRGVYTPAPEETMALGLSAGELVARIARLRMANGAPLAIERATLSARVLPHPEAMGPSLYAALEGIGSRPVRAIQRISAGLLDESEAAMLGVPRGSPSLNIERISYLASGKVIEFTRSRYRADAYDFVTELRLAEPPPGTGAES